MKNAFSVLAIAAVFLAALQSSAVAQNYTITDLGLLQGSTFAEGMGVSNAGQVVGLTEPSPNSIGTAFLWTKAAGIHQLKLPSGYSNSAAFAINNRGDAVGQAAAPTGSLHALLWLHNGRVIDLGAPTGSSGSTAYDVNDLDEVIGWGDTTAFLWTESAGFQDLGTLPGGTFTVGWRVNLSGEAVGFGDTPGGNDHAFLWTKKNGFRELRLLPGGSTSEALGNNNFRQIVGASDSSDSSSLLHAVLWSGDGADIRDLGTLPGYISSGANAVNDLGEVVGESYGNGYNTGHAFLWTAGAGMLDLNTLIPANSGWVLNLATFINVKGQISGYGVIGGQTHAFLLTPTGN